MKLNIKGVIFDFNGTLFFDNDKHIMAWNQISQLLRGCPISEQELHERFNGTPNAEIISYMMNDCATNDDILKYSLLKEEYYRQFCQTNQESFHLVAGASEYFDSLKRQGIPFTIASASIKENIDFFRKSFDLDRWIQPHSIIYDNWTYSNKVQMFKDAAQCLDVPIQDSLVFEDSFSGIRNAYEAGVHHIIVVCPLEKKAQYENLPGVIKTIENFEGLL